MTALKKDLLIVLPEIPYPIRAQGISIRYYPIIERLSMRYNIDLVIITDKYCNAEYLKHLRQYCRTIENIIYPDKKTIPKHEIFITRIGFFLPWTLPRSWTVYGSSLLNRKVFDMTKDCRYDIALTVTGFVYPYIAGVKASKYYMDFIDSPSLLTKRNVIGSSRTKIVRMYESIKTKIWEIYITNKFDKVFYISKHDTLSIPKFAAPMKKKIVIPNGFAADDYVDIKIKSMRKPSLAFIGNMSYYPNVEAVEWLVKGIYHSLKNIFPDLSIYIIGREPDDRIMELAKEDGVFVTGEVDSIWPYVNSVDIFVFPLVRGAGLKNKILEAMYANKPVLTTRIGNEGIDAEPGKELIVCDSEEEFCHEISKLLMDDMIKDKLAEAGKNYVLNNFAWSKIMNKLDEHFK